MFDLQKLLYTIFLQSPPNLFDQFIIECQKYYEKPAHSLLEIKQRDNKKLKGDIFEEFCLLYLKYIKKFNNVWLLKNVPHNILIILNMKRQDMGIDIIIEHNNIYKAVQCKYKKKYPFKKNILSWKQLSTFYALCLKTGPFDKYIVMTNCDYTRHQGIKNEKDLSICLKTFQNINTENWLKMCNIKSNKIYTNIIIFNKDDNLINHNLINLNDNLINHNKDENQNKDDNQNKDENQINQNDNQINQINQNEKENLRNLRLKYFSK